MAAGQGRIPGRPAAATGRRGCGDGVAFAARDTIPRGGNDLPAAATGRPFRGCRATCVRRTPSALQGRGPHACCGSRARPHVWSGLPAPRGGRPAAPRRTAAAPRGDAAPRGGRRLVLGDPHVPAPDVSGPRWSRPWERLLIPDQKARRQRTGRSYTPRELAPAQAAPLMPRPWKPMPRRSAGRQPPAPKAGAVNLRGLTVHRPR